MRVANRVRYEVIYLDMGKDVGMPRFVFRIVKGYWHKAVMIKQCVGCCHATAAGPRWQCWSVKE